MEEHLQRETTQLQKSWMQHDQVLLRDYLVSGVEDPRINVQSILTRHSLITALFADRFRQLMDHELRFSAIMSWAEDVLEQAGSNQDLQAVRHALGTGADNAEGIPVPRYVAQVYGTLPLTSAGCSLPNYIEEILKLDIDNRPESTLPEEVVSTFERIWHSTLSVESPAPISVLEVACGSANDYRYLSAFGLARLIEYTGLDLCEKNIANAKAMFPEAHFSLGNALSLEWPDQTFDQTLVQDLFEHLSELALGEAMKEICRVTRRCLCLGFFNVHEGMEHQVKPVEDYHWNRLSLPKLKDQLIEHDFAPRVVHIDTLLRWHFGFPDTHNKNAYTLLAERIDPPPH